MAEDKSTQPFAWLLGASLSVKNGHMFAAADDAEEVDLVGQTPRQFAVRELVPATTWFMASASELEKFLTKSPYLPSFECLTSSRQKGSAMARISGSVFSMMFTRDSSRPIDRVHRTHDR
jgi:hypothetical protein